MRQYFFPLVLLCGFALGACGDETRLIRPGGTEVLLQNPPTEVDILLVVDNSCSMEDEQEKLSQGFEDFVAYFDVADVDYHIAVATTDMDSDRGALVDAGGAAVIDNETDDAADVFQENVQVGVSGAAMERGLDAAIAALTEPMVSESSFLRDDALLTIIWVSDEEDASIGPVAEFINAFRDLKGSERRDAFNASALVGLDNQTEEPGDCNLSDSNPNFGAHASWRYTDVVRQTGGVVGSICEDDFSDVVSQMGLTSSRLVDRFAVSRRPKANSIEMTMHVPGTPEFEGDGVVVPAEGLDGQWPWEYQEDVPAEDYAIQFTDPTSLPPLNTRIILRYDYY